jgi:hypothetical protein
MKRFFASAVLLSVLSVPAFAASNSQTITIPDTVKVGSTQLPAGDYKISWTGAGASAQVTIAKNGIAPVTLQAKVVEQKNEHSGVTTNAVGGSNVLQAIQLNHVSLIVEGPEAAGQ